MMRHRTIVTVTLRATSPVRIGSSIDRPLDEAGNADGSKGEPIPIARDHRGQPILPGTSAAGVLRRLLERRFGRRLPELFGDVTRDDEGDTDAVASALIIDDAPATTPTRLPETTDRWRTAFDRKRDAAATHLLFGAEELPLGTTFTLRLQLDDPTGAALGLLAELLQLIHSNRFRVGAATRSGFGELECATVEVREMRIGGVETLRTWLLADDRDALAEPVDDVPGWIAANRKKAPKPSAEPDPAIVGRPEPAVRFRLHLRPVDPLHSSGETVTEGGWEVSKMSRLGDDFALAGPGLRGAIRSRAERIVRTVNGSDTVWNPNLAHRVSVPEPEKVDPATDLFGSTEAAGWTEFSFTTIDDPAWQLAVHVAIDRFTGGAAPGKLFREEIVTDGGIELVVTLAGDRPEHVGLLALVLFDLATGDLPIGSGRYRGQGTVRATKFTVEFASDAEDGSGSWVSHETDLSGLEDWRSRDAFVAALGDDLRRQLSGSVEALWSKESAA